MLFDERKENIEAETNKMVDIEVPTCCSTKTALFNEVHIVCMSIFIMFGELYAKTQVMCPRGDTHRSVLPVAASKPVLSCS